MTHTTPPNRCITAPWDPSPGLCTLTVWRRRNWQSARKRSSQLAKRRHSAVSRVRRSVAPSLRVTCAPGTPPESTFGSRALRVWSSPSRWAGSISSASPTARPRSPGSPRQQEPSGSDLLSVASSDAAPNASLLALSGQQAADRPTEEREQITAEEIAQVHRAEVDEVVAVGARATRRWSTIPGRTCRSRRRR